jgi:hypothetical protein
LNRIYGFPFPAKGVGTLEGAKFTTSQWWASNKNFGTSRASAASATWERLENLRPLVDPITGDITAAERSARQAPQSLHRESADQGALRAQVSANAATQEAAEREARSLNFSSAALTTHSAERREEAAARTALLTDTPSSPAPQEQWNVTSNAPSSGSLRARADASASTSFGVDRGLGRSSTRETFAEGLRVGLSEGNDNAPSSASILGTGGLGTRPALHFTASTAAARRSNPDASDGLSRDNSNGRPATRPIAPTPWVRTFWTPP